MDNVLMLAVAGAGKTTYLVKGLNEVEQFLIVTYTTNNVANLRCKIIQRFGYFPPNITLLSYYVFLYHICFLPFAKIDINPQGIYWEQPDPQTLMYKRDNPAFYITKDRRLYHNRIAKFCHDHFLLQIKQRIEMYFDHFYFDEVQDLASHDFDFIHDLLPLNIDTLLVGDFFQHTFDTSVDGNLHSGLYKDRGKYIKLWNNVKINTRTLSNSFRCTKQICDFVSTNLGIVINSHYSDDSQVIVINKKEDADAVFSNSHIIKLVYQESHRYSFAAMNWGASKGLDDFNDVCVILNKIAYAHFTAGSLSELPPSSRNKLYVACTRARRYLYIVSDVYAADYKTK